MQLIGQTDGPTDRRTDGPTDGPTDRRTDGLTDRRTDNTGKMQAADKQARRLAGRQAHRQALTCTREGGKAGRLAHRHMVTRPPLTPNGTHSHTRVCTQRQARRQSRQAATQAGTQARRHAHWCAGTQAHRHQKRCVPRMCALVCVCARARPAHMSIHAHAQSLHRSPNLAAHMLVHVRMYMSIHDTICSVYPKVRVSYRV